MRLLLADPGQMHQIVDNLLQNAIEAIGTKPGVITVRTGRQLLAGDEVFAGESGRRPRPGEHVFVEVQDTGIGMSADTQRQMFDPFFTTKFTGRGLGMATMQGIVRQHRGSIRVDSIPNGGTTIRVLLAASDTNPPLPGLPASIEPRRGSETILVVDDEPLVLATTRASIASYGYRVLTATGGRQAMEQLRTTPEIAVLLLDASMPEMDGVTALREIRISHPDLPVLVCSGLGDAATEAAFAGLGVRGFLHKPYSLDQLGGKLAACLPPNS